MTTPHHDPVMKRATLQWFCWGRWLCLSFMSCGALLGTSASYANPRGGSGEVESTDVSVTVIDVTPWLSQISGTTGKPVVAPAMPAKVPVPSSEPLPAAVNEQPSVPALMVPTLAPTALPQASPVAQAPAENVQNLQDRLQSFQSVTNFGNVFEGSPAITIANPAGYGADGSTLFASATFQSRTRSTQQSDGAIGLGYGFGDSVNLVGAELSYTFASFGQNGRDFGTGGFNAKIHRQLPGEFAVAVGWNGFVTTGNRFNEDFKDSVYGVVTKVFRVQEDINEPFSRIAVSAGAGSGQFRSEGDIRNRVNSISPFGSIAVRIIQPVSAVVEWTGQDLAAGISFVPIKGVNWSITPAVRDIAGAGDGARFVLGTSFSIQF